MAKTIFEGLWNSPKKFKNAYFGKKGSYKRKAWKKFVKNDPPTGNPTEFPLYDYRKCKWYWLELDEEVVSSEDLKQHDDG